MDNLSLILQAISTLCFFLGVFVIQSFKKSLDDMQRSVNTLNINIATLVEKDTNKDERLAEHKESINRLNKEVDRMRDKYHNSINDVGGRLALLELKFNENNKGN